MKHKERKEQHSKQKKKVSNWESKTMCGNWAADRFERGCPAERHARKVAAGKLEPIFALNVKPKLSALYLVHAMVKVPENRRAQIQAVI